MNQNRDPLRGYHWECRHWRQNAASPSWRGAGYTRQRENEEYEPRQLDYTTGLDMVDAQRKKVVAAEQPSFGALDEMLA